MAHFAKVEEGLVTEVIVVDNSDITDGNGDEQESLGIDFINNTLNQSGTWKQTSYNTYGNAHENSGTPLRGNYAGIGYTWDEDDQIFWPKKPYASWVKNTTDARWQSPIGDAPALTAEQTSQNEASTHKWSYVWNETNQTWDLTDLNA